MATWARRGSQVRGRGPITLTIEPDVGGPRRERGAAAHLVEAAYILFRAAWRDAGHAAAPLLVGRVFSLDTTLLDEPIYAIHVWVWRHDPLGILANRRPARLTRDASSTKVSSATCEVG